MVAKAIFDIARYSFESGTKNLELAQEQANKGLELAMTTGKDLGEEMLSACQEWQKSSMIASKTYLQNLQNGFDLFEKVVQFTDRSGESTTVSTGKEQKQKKAYMSPGAVKRESVRPGSLTEAKCHVAFCHTTPSRSSTALPSMGFAVSSTHQ